MVKFKKYSAHQPHAYALCCCFSSTKNFVVHSCGSCLGWTADSVIPAYLQYAGKWDERFAGNRTFFPVLHHFEQYRGSLCRQYLTDERGRHPLLKPANLTAIAVYIFVVGLVYNLVLRQLWSPLGWQWVADNLLHVVTPILYLLYWWQFVPDKPQRWKLALLWLLYPAIYFVYAIIRGQLEGVYPYPFIDVNQLGFQKVFINALIIMLLFLATGWGFLALGRGRKL